ncbi:hypothetical protein ACFQ09_21990 [Massilia norwichensis]|uniref:Uncharacterized protein n=1 Tax=Massilia norwichensis TaxID=1442366 RepID=A0ABT2A661_9BURK|nr:hypothetical protein [Massilia norwichensis]MCS0589686.1 hypothetical protein [Massilia norwichensis]
MAKAGMAAASRARRDIRDAVRLAIPMGVTLVLFYAGELGLIPSSGPLAWTAALCAALVMASALVGLGSGKSR